LQGRIEVVTPGIDHAPGRCDAAQQRAARRSLGLPEQGTGLLLVGNDFKKKGLPALLRALVDMPQADWLAVVGHSRQLPQMEAMAVALGLAARVHFLGARSEMEPAYRAADLLVHPTLEDSYAMVVLEAMAYGLPVVLSGPAFCGIAAHLRQGVDACLVDAPDSELALRAAVSGVLGDAALRQSLSVHGHAFAQRAHWDGVAQAHAALFARLCQLRRARWLVLSHAFNMDGRAASQTITDKMPHLAAAGIELVVLSGVLGRRDTVYEHHPIWPLGPAGIRFEMRHVLRKHLPQAWLYRVVMVLLSLPLLPFMFIEKLFWRIESSWSWWLSAYVVGRWLMYRRRFDLIYSTGGAYAAHIAGAALKRATGVPWMAEVHDPMVVPGSKPSTPQQIKQAQVEGLICAQADLAIWFTEQALASARKRHSGLGGRGKAMVPGVDPPQLELQPYRRGEHFVIAHFGSLAPTRNLVRVVAAVEQVLRVEPALRGVLQVHTYGGPLDALSAQAIERSDARDAFVHFGRLETDPVSGVSGRDQIAQRMRSADVLLLLHGTDPICAEYIPSKLYEYLWMQRPILALVHENPQMAAMLVAQHHVVIQTSPQSESGDATQGALGQAIQVLAQAWQRGHNGEQAPSSTYSTRAAVRQILSWQQRSTGGLA
jgi:glycosyltransferase involved in cell wall biosynthesis